MSQVKAILWIDIETTGLNPGKDAILEAAYLVTDIYGRVLSDEYSVLFKFPGAEIAGEFITHEHYAFVRKMHSENGLIADLLNPENKLWDIWQLSSMLLSLTNEVEEILSNKVFWYLGGSSVHTDRAHLEANGVELPVSHRHLDLSSLKLFAEATGLAMPQAGGKRSHRALGDIQEDVQIYRNYVQLIEGKL